MNSRFPQPHREPRPWFRRLLAGYFVVIFGLITFFLGLFYGAVHYNRLSSADVLDTIIGRSDEFVSDKNVDFDTYWRVWQTIATDYVGEDVSDQQLLDGSIAGMVAALKDPYSVFLDAQMAQEFNDEIQGTFQGIGAEIGFQGDQLVVIAPLPASPAEQAGLRANDAILAINGTDTKSMTVDMAVSLIRGEEGSTVALLIQTGDDDPREVSIVRQTISMASVTHETLDGNIMLITITRFADDTVQLFDEAVQDALVLGVDGIILDLRNDPGGYLDSAVQIGMEFVGDKPIVLEQYRDLEPTVYTNGETAARVPDVPLVVLVNGGSASAAEILAGALQDYDRGTILGEQTFGKGSVQDLHDFEDGSVLKLTVAHWLTPTGRSIDKTGIIPDRVVEMTEEDYTSGRDPQMDAAKETLITPTE